MRRKKQSVKDKTINERSKRSKSIQNREKNIKNYHIEVRESDEKKNCKQRRGLRQGYLRNGRRKEEKYG